MLAHTVFVLIPFGRNTKQMEERVCGNRQTSKDSQRKHFHVYTRPSISAWAISSASP